MLCVYVTPSFPALSSSPSSSSSSSSSSTADYQRISDFLRKRHQKHKPPPPPPPQAQAQAQPAIIDPTLPRQPRMTPHPPLVTQPTVMDIHTNRQAPPGSGVDAYDVSLQLEVVVTGKEMSLLATVCAVHVSYMCRLQQKIDLLKKKPTF